MGKESKSKKDISVSNLSGEISLSNTSTQELTTALIKHLIIILETFGAREFTPTTLFQLRDSPAVTLAADLLYSRGSLFPSRKKLTPSPVPRGKIKICLSEIWRRNSDTISGKGCAVAEYLEPGAGLIVSLPFDLISPFARTASLLSIKSSVRYQIGKVYSSRATGSTEGNRDDRNNVLENRGQNPLAPLGVGSGEHPFGSNEVVFDILRSGLHYHKVDIECEVITAALNCISVLRPNLPVIAIRVTDSRLLDALLEVCLWPRPSSATVNATATSTFSSASSSSIRQSEVRQGQSDDDIIDIERLLRAFSLCTDIEDNASEEVRIPKYLQLLRDLDLPSWLAKRLIPFFKLASQQFTPPSAHSQVYTEEYGNKYENKQYENKQYIGYPLSVLSALEKEFYNLDPIIGLQRVLAKEGQRRNDNERNENDNDDEEWSELYKNKEKKERKDKMKNIPMDKNSLNSTTHKKDADSRKSSKSVPQNLAAVLSVIGVQNKKNDSSKEREKGKGGGAGTDSVSTHTTLQDQNSKKSENENLRKDDHLESSTQGPDFFSREDLAR